MTVTKGPENSVCAAMVDYSKWKDIEVSRALVMAGTICSNIVLGSV